MLPQTFPWFIEQEIEPWGSNLPFHYCCIQSPASSALLLREMNLALVSGIVEPAMQIPYFSLYGCVHNGWTKTISPLATRHLAVFRMLASNCDSVRLPPPKEDVFDSTEPEAEAEQRVDLDTGSAFVDQLHARQLGPFTMIPSLLPMKLYYFFYFGALACVAPYLPLFYRYMSMSARQTGVITGLHPCVTFVAKPFWAAIGDKFRRHKIVMVAVLMVSSFLLFSLVFLPRPAVPVGDEFCDLVECVGRINDSTSLNHSKCRVFVDGQSSQTTTDPIHINRTFIIQCCISGYLRNLFCDREKYLKLGNGTVPHGNIFGERQRFSTGESLLKLLFRCIREITNHTPSDGSEGGFSCRPMCTQRFDSGSNYSVCLENVQNPWPGVTWKERGEDRNYTENGNPNNSKMFILLLVIVLTAFFFYVIDSMADAVVVKALSKMGRSGDFGKQRLWGAIGWGLVSILASLGIDESANFKKQNHFLIPFCGFLALNFITAICVWKLPTNVLLEGQTKPKVLRNLKAICTSYQIVMFLLVALVFGVCHGMIGIYLFWFLQDLGGSYLLMGLCLVVSCSAEIPMMFFAGHLTRICGYHGIFYLTFFCYSVRFLCYSFLSNPWFVLAVEPLHGMTFGVFWSAAASYGGMIAPPGMAATVIGLVGAAHFGLGYVTAGFAGGTLYSIYGARNTFRGLAVTLMVIGLLYAMSQELPKHTSRCGSASTSGATVDIPLDAQEVQGMISQGKQIPEGSCWTATVPKSWFLWRNYSNFYRILLSVMLKNAP